MNPKILRYVNTDWRLFPAAMKSQGPSSNTVEVGVIFFDRHCDSKNKVLLLLVLALENSELGFG